MSLGGQIDQRPWALIAVFAVFAIAGIVLLDRAARKNRGRGAAPAPKEPALRKGSEKRG